MMHYLIEIDKSLLLYLNSSHTTFLDFIMYWLSNRPIWIPLYAFLIYLLYRDFKNDFWKPLLLVLISIILANTLSVNLFKNVFLRLRPCHEPDLQDLIYLLNGRCGGLYGFVSSHAANTFALASSLFFIYDKKRRALIFIMLSWAGLVSISRVYLGVHYPSDVIGGALLGCVISTFIYFISRKIRFLVVNNRPDNKSNLKHNKQ